MSEAPPRTPDRRASSRSQSAKDSRHPSHGWFSGALGAPRCLRAALYARVSSSDQQSLPTQLRVLKRYAAERGWSVVSETREIGSGSKARPQREEIVRAARRKQIDVVIVWKLDRWGRSVADLAITLQELHELGVAFVSVTEAIDLTTAAGRAMAGLLSVFSQFEQEVRRERILAGIAEARAKGVHLGRPPKVVVRLAALREAHAEGKTISAIAREFKIARSTVRAYLRKA